MTNNLETKNKYSGKKFSILGDSSSTLIGVIPENYKPFYDNNNCARANINDINDTWWGRVINFLGGTLLANSSYSGSKVTSDNGMFPCINSVERVKALSVNGEAPDIVIVYAGFNDWAKGMPCNAINDGRPMTSFFDFSYLNMIIKITNEYPDAEIWCCTLCSTLMSSNPDFVFPHERYGVNIEQFNDVIRGVASRPNCKILDLFNYNVSVDTIDSAHPNASGMKTLSNLICKSVDESTKDVLCEEVNETSIQPIENYPVFENITVEDTQLVEQTEIEEQNKPQGFVEEQFVISNFDQSPLCNNNEHNFVFDSEETGYSQYICTKCRKELNIPSWNIALENYSELKNYVGSLIDGRLIDSSWFENDTQPDELHKIDDLSQNKEITVIDNEQKFESVQQKETENQSAICEDSAQSDCQKGLDYTVESCAELLCPQCKNPVNNDDRFCMLCGCVLQQNVPISNSCEIESEKNDSDDGIDNTNEPVELICPQCKNHVNRDDKFCMTCGCDLQQTSSASLINSSKIGKEDVIEIIGDRYELVRKIGKGASSVVYLAKDIKLDRVCAIKVVSKASYTDQMAVKESLDEANKLKLLAHVSIPQLYDIFDEENRLCIVMEYLEGQNLKEIIESSNKPLDEFTIVSWAKQLCRVLYYLHTLKPARIYRDLKPSNIILQPNGVIKLIDFGIMKIYDDGVAEDTVNLGTKGYAAPEQFGGRGATDARTDIYSLGMTLFHLTTGVNPAKSPYEVKSISSYRQDISKNLDNIITKCTMISREDRYQSCAEILNELNKIY